MEPTQPTKLPSDLRSKVAQCYVDDREFNDPDTGRLVKYKKLITAFVVDGEVVEFAAPVKKNDPILLKYAEDYSRGM